MVDISVVAPTGGRDIDGILWGWKWDTTTLTYSFPTGPAEYTSYAAIEGFRTFNASQQDAVRRLLANVSAVAGLTFTETTAAGADLRFANVGEINYSNDPSVLSGETGLHVPGSTSAEANPPELPYGGNPPTSAPYAQGDGWFSPGYTAPALGSFAYAAGLMHETGHNLGLKHGHAEQDGHGVTFPTLPYDHNSYEYSVMTYSQYPGSDTEAGDGAPNHPTTFMQDDIAALQYLYGANYGTNAGNTVYTWNPLTGEESVDGVAQGAPDRNFILMTLWDGGGTDTYDLSNYGTNLTIDLGPGQWSTFSTVQLADLGNTGERESDYVARGNLANALLYQDDASSLIENATGGSGNDALTGNLAGNTLAGGAGNDTLNGLAGNDLLLGSDGDDSVQGGEGDDFGSGGWGRDTVLGGGGNDLLFGDDDDDTVEGGAGDDLVYGGTGHDSVSGGAGTDRLWGEAGNDTLAGGDDGDFADGGDGDDLVSGGAGNDTVFGSLGNDTVQGESGDDFIGAGDGNDRASGGSGNDEVHGEGGNDRLFGDEGDDGLYGEAGDDTLDGGPGRDTLFGGDGRDRLQGGDDDDALYGGADADTLGGGDGDDFASGGDGRDDLHGGSGDDLLFGDEDDDVLEGDDGADRLYGGTGNDGLSGEDGRDRLFGEDGGDRLSGGAGGDDLSGGAGNDTLDGGTGADLLFGNSGDDVLTGGAGIDVFAFGAGDGLDRILDFVLGGAEADVIAFNSGAFADFAGVQAASRQDGADLVIAYGAGDALTLAGVQLGALSAASFTFA
ncbi:M10 family metallopeptidase [Methylobacterium oryzihabitans]|uniref:Peptidase metallopeptidase domain-containing protein n=1 Tax=Methylobacterium oryzihabitans TaxID=2499852 RepID=A0A3S2W5G4_9HYPH|nr:M10 family metallopeptidase [Methylobacterium oryzihabitans]RVU14141.1 hypothetical protein EOE48_24635 [Methylobacterium oryzihabitans]